MIGIVLVSHSETLAKGVLELMQQMVQDRVPIAIAAGTDNPDEPIGTDPMQVMAAIDSVYSADGVLVLMDLGSALMSAETAIEFLDPDKQENIYLCEAPIVEGGLAAAVTAAGNAPIEQVISEARSALNAKLGQLEPMLRIPPETQATAANIDQIRDALNLTITVPNQLGLHARPAAKLVAIANQFPNTQIQIANGQKRAIANSINQVATLGARHGDTLTVHAAGPNAQTFLDAITAFAAANFGDPIDTAPTPQPSSQLGTPPTDESLLNDNVVQGVAASTGTAIGAAYRHEVTFESVAEQRIDDVPAEQNRLADAIAAAQSDLAELHTWAQQTLSTNEADILAAHQLILQDPELIATANAHITAQQINAESSWQHAIVGQMEEYRSLPDPYMAARADDVKDVGQRVLMQLLGVEHQPPTLSEPAILVCRELTPSDAAGLLPEVVLGIVTERGGATGHSAILARALGIPAVVGASGVMRNVAEGQLIGIDGESGEVLLAPSVDKQQQLADRRAAWLADRTESAAAAQRPAKTQDGKQVEIGANIGSADDATRALEFGAEGVGLFRTELLFMARPEAPSEEEQTEAYAQAAAAFQAHDPNAMLLIRTLDVGGDKPIGYLSFGQEENPFLGWRGIRFCLEQPEIFSTQLRAILRASANHAGIRIMFPMVGTVDEVQQAKALVQRAKDELTAEQIDFNDAIEIGIMIEVPSAVLIADQLAQVVDFFSIGTNDLTQYILAADRGNARVAGLVNALDPAVLRAIAQVTDAAHKHGKWVGMCGELAGNATAIPLLIGLGLDELSMSAPSIPTVKEAIRNVDTAAATALAQQALACSSAQEVETLLESLS